MEMEDQHHHNHQHQQYGLTDLRNLMNGPRSSTTHFPSIQSEVFSSSSTGPHRNNLSPLAVTTSHHQQHYEMMMFRGLHHEFAPTHDSSLVAVPTSNNTTNCSITPSLISGLEAAEGAGVCLGGDASTGRWPRQETLTLLEIRSRLDSKFKEANQKGPLWDEVSRIMCEEHGYQRSGKKCREKFENLYKYYKKTKEGKAGRQDGKHYRFFRQLEALYGDQNNNHQTCSSLLPPPQTTSFPFQQTNIHSDDNNNNKQHCDSLSLTNSTTHEEFDTSSCDDDNSIDENERRKMRKSGGRRSWKVKIKEFIDSQMKRLMEKQEEWLDKLMKTLDQKEKERVVREEEWRKQEALRLEREHKFWAKERAWIEVRDAALMDALQKLTGREIKVEQSHMVVDNEIQQTHHCENNQNEQDGSEILNSTVVRGGDSWLESEIATLQQLRAQSGGCSSDEVVIWEEVANKMACFGYERTASMCKEKWESISSSSCNYPRGDVNKKRKENLTRTSCFYFVDHQSNSLYNQQGTSTSYCDHINDQRQERLQTNDHGSSSPSNSNVGNVAQVDHTCFHPFLMSESGSLWENYGLKLNKGNQNH